MKRIGSLKAFFEEAARRGGAAEFAGAGGVRVMTSEEAIRTAALWADRWSALALRPRFVAVIWMDLSPDFLLAFASIVFAGGIPVPLHPYSGAEEAMSLAARLEAEMIVLAPAGKELLLAMPEAGLHPAVYMDGTTGLPLEGPFSLRPAQGIRRTFTPPAETALIFMTSGSSGKPKGVMLSARNALANVEAIRGYTSLGADDRVLLYKSPAHCSSVVGEWFLAFAAGARLLLSPGLPHPLSLIGKIRDLRPTFLCAVPATMNALAKSPGWRSEDAASLRQLLVIGGAMPQDALLQLQRRMQDTRIMPSYGLTEASPRVSFLPAHRLADKPGSVGIPVAGVKLSVMRAGRPAAPGETGEIVVRGPNVMLGYYDEPELTAQTLGPRGLRTRDAGYIDGEGYLHLCGRLDSAMNVGGHTLYPEAVEHALETHAEVREAAVAGVPDPVWTERIVALVAPLAGQPDPAAFIRRLADYCRERLPSASRPREIHIVERIPRTATGKPDRSAVKLAIKDIHSSEVKSHV